MAETREIKKPKIFANTTELSKEASGRVVEVKTSEEETKQVPKHGVQKVFVGPVSYRKTVHGAQVMGPGVVIETPVERLNKLIAAKNVDELIKLTESGDAETNTEDKDSSEVRFGLLELE